MNRRGFSALVCAVLNTSRLPKDDAIALAALIPVLPPGEDAPPYGSVQLPGGLSLQWGVSGPGGFSRWISPLRRVHMCSAVIDSEPPLVNVGIREFSHVGITTDGRGMCWMAVGE